MLFFFFFPFNLLCFLKVAKRTAGIRGIRSDFHWKDIFHLIYLKTRFMWITWHPILYSQGIKNWAKEICLGTQICNSDSKKECEYKSWVVYQGFRCKVIKKFGGVFHIRAGSKKGSSIDPNLKDYTATWLEVKHRKACWLDVHILGCPGNICKGIKKRKRRGILLGNLSLCLGDNRK